MKFLIVYLVLVAFTFGICWGFFPEIFLKSSGRWHTIFIAFFHIALVKYGYMILAIKITIWWDYEIAPKFNKSIPQIG